MEQPAPATIDEIKNFLGGVLEEYGTSQATHPKNSRHQELQITLMAGILIALCEHAEKPYIFVDAYAVVSDFFGDDIRGVTEHSRSIPHQHLKGLVGLRFRSPTSEVLYLQATNQAGAPLNTQANFKDVSLVLCLGKDEMRLWPIALADLEKLKEFILTDKFDALPEIERKDLKAQLGHMQGYHDVLSHRVSRQCNSA